MIRTPGIARLQFVAAAGLLSGAIERWGVSTPGFSHVDIVMSTGWLLGARDETITVNGVKYAPGVQLRPPGYATWIRRQIVEFNVAARDLRVANGWARDMIGHKYDEDAILGIIFGQRWHKNGDFICSAFGAGYLRRLSASVKLFEPAQQTSPNTLYAMAGAAGGTLVTS